MHKTAAYQDHRKRDKRKRARMSKRRTNIPPVGSEEGNMSWPQMLHAATPVTMAAKVKKGARELVARSSGVGMVD
jgi:hypothetical protein